MGVFLLQVKVEYIAVYKLVLYIEIVEWMEMRRYIQGREGKRTTE